MDKEKILEWMSRTEFYRIRGYENNDGIQTLVLVSPKEPGGILRRTYRSGYFDFSPYLKKNPLWKRLFWGEKYANLYKKTTTVDAYRIVIREAIGDNVFWQADVENNPVLVQLVAESGKRIVVFRQALKAYFAEMALKTKNNMYPFLSYLYEELCLRHPEKQTGLEYVRLLLCRCSQETDRQKDSLETLKNPLEYLDKALCKGFPYESIIYGYVESVYARICQTFYGDVSALASLVDCSESMVIQLNGGVDDCMVYMRLPKLLNAVVDYLECK